MSPKLRCLAGGILLVLACSPVRADEGMWTFDNPPLQQLHERYGFAPDRAWLDHRSLPVLRVDSLLPAVEIPPGTRATVRLLYRPRSLVFGTLLTIATIVLATVLLARSSRRTGETP